MALITLDRVGTASALPGQMLLIRDGVVVQDYGDTRVTEDDYGIGFLAALAATQPGDMLLCGPLRAALVNATLLQNNVKIYCIGTTLTRNANYTHLLRVTGNDNCVQGLTVDGEAVANTGSGAGIWVSGTRVLLDNCESNGTRGTNPTNGDGSALRMDGCSDCVVTNYRSTDAGYNAIWLRTANRTIVNGAETFNSLRAIGINGTSNMDWLRLQNIHSKSTIAGQSSLMNMNINNGVELGELIMDNVHLEDGDMIGAGVSYNDADGHQMLKVQNVRKLVMDKVRLDHGSNAGAGDVRSLFIQAFESNTPPEELVMRECNFADASVIGMKVPYIFAENCHFGSKQLADYAELFYRLRAEYAKFTGNTFNIHGKRKTIAIHNTFAAGDFLEFRHNHFTGSNASNQYVFRANDLSSDNTSLGNFAGRVIFDKTNTMENTGGAAFYRSDDEYETLVCTTDPNGDLLWDDSIIGVGENKHPDPGAGPAFFPGFPAINNGTKIWHINWSPDETQVSGVLERAWIAHSGTWKDFS